MNVLIAVDVNEALFAQAIISFVGSHHWPDGSIFRVLYVKDPFDVEFYSKYIETQNLAEELQTAALSSSNEIAEKLKELLPKHEISAHVSLGHPGETVLEYARSWPADIIILGSQGKRGLNRLILGSVSSAVASNSPCSVAVLSLPKSDVSEGIKDVKDKKKILVPVAEEEYANLVCSFLCQHDFQKGSEIQFLYVLEPLLVGNLLAFLPSPILNEIKDRHLNDGNALIGKLTADLQEKLVDVKVTNRIIEGFPTDTILELAADWEADWICLGSHARRGLKRMLLGSVAMGVLHRSSCSTLILHPSIPHSAASSESDN